MKKQSLGAAGRCVMKAVAAVCMASIAVLPIEAAELENPVRPQVVTAQAYVTEDKDITISVTIPEITCSSAVPEA